MFSIITVTYNAEATIERTIHSVMSQTALEHIEYIIIDGASTDKTLDIIRNSKLETRNFQLISEADSGLYDAMNKGLQRATGDYVWFLNAGDTLHDNNTVAHLLSLVVPNLSPCTLHPSPFTPHSSPDILYGETDIVDNDGKFIARRRLKAPKKLNWKNFRMGMLVSHQSFVVKREIAPLYDLQYHYSADVDWCICCMKDARTIHNSHLILSNYLNEGMTTANRKASLKERFSIMVKYYGWWPTAIRHLWFFIRYNYNKLLNKQL
ncbi:MAG: glycosyltransferase [Prevotellaceae bacterium]|jgi:glycosyltransferase involved in cell wall biosynthesis|nr:glycosyltransferase [Prevotellaceae bacterium]